jgi:phosphogluconate dehydratase
MTTLHPVIADVTARIRDRSRNTRNDYLGRMEEARAAGRSRTRLDCGNLAHACAAAPFGDKAKLRGGEVPNIAIVTAYNDMLSAHQPLGTYPDLIKETARTQSCTAQVAGGVPAMCDGITQGRPGMELSLFSRDVIALATAVSLSHNVFDATLCLGVCDKIVPGLLIGALAFGHLPTIFVPAGPMPSGIPNEAKARVREAFARGDVGRGELLEAETASYHTSGTCTFFGTANSNQMLMEVMGLHMPGAAFVNPGTPLRDALTRAAATQACVLAHEHRAALFEVIDERAVVNGVVGLMASGGSTNHTLHLPAIARAAGILLDWEDFDAISRVTPLIARIYPNGAADVNQFHAAGGLAFLIRELLDAGLLHGDTTTVAGQGLRAYAQEPALANGELSWRTPVAISPDRSVLRSSADPFDSEGGLRLLRGNLGRAVMKVSAVSPGRRSVEAPALVFDDQEDFLAAFKRGALTRDFIAVLRFQGPKANGMPELHKLTPQLSVLQDRGYRVGLVTDGRMSGASGKVPAAIHVTPEALNGGAIGRICDGDVIRIDAERGVLEARVPQAELAARAQAVHRNSTHGSGREMFKPFRRMVGEAEFGASIFS